MKKYLLFNLAILLIFNATAQKISGIILSGSGELLPYSSITIKGTSLGASANENAQYSLQLNPGTYTIVCQRVGYITEEKTVQLQKDVLVNFTLELQKFSMEEVVVKTGGEDPAYNIIRNAIRKREQHNKEVNAFQCDLYTKDLVKLRNVPKKIFGKKVEVDDMGLDSTGKGIIYLSESIADINVKRPDKFKMEVKSSRVSGSSGFGFSFPTFISMYESNVTVFSSQLNPRGFVSPIADGAIGFYKFKFLGSYFENGKEINSIRVTPRRNYEPLFSGIINIIENEWRIHSFDLLLTKISQLEILDSLQITQQYVPVSSDKWMVKNQLLHFSAKVFGFDAVGNFVNVYSDYNIKPDFNKNFFDRVVIKYDTAVNKKTVAYWDSIRPVPLETEEMRDYKVKDSLFLVNKDSALTKNSIDSLKKRQGPLKPQKIFIGGIRRTHYSLTNRYNWGIEGLIPNMEYNTVEAVVVNAAGYIEKYNKKLKSNVRIEPNLRYGFSNTHLNAWLNVEITSRNRENDKKLKRQALSFSGGKRVTEFNKESSLNPFVNSISVLFYGKNYIKTYENYYGLINFNKVYESGVRLNFNALYEDRMPLSNTTNFTIYKKDSVNITPNYPVEKITAAENFRHQAFIVSAEVSYQPGQRYIQFPYYKMSIGSKYPVFNFKYTKGISAFGSDVNFDKWDLGMSSSKNFKLGGLLKYKLGIGGFLNDDKVTIQDYKHFNGNKTIAAAPYVNSFQLAPYYANSTTAAFYSVGHLEHHFNGLLTNKIPLFKRLNWNLVGGANAFYVNDNNNYIEFFAGIENIFKIFRVDFVAAYQNGSKGLTGIRIGSGGLIGGSVKRASNNTFLKGNYKGKLF